MLEPLPDQGKRESSVQQSKLKDIRQKPGWVDHRKLDLSTTDLYYSGRNARIFSKLFSNPFFQLIVALD